VLGSWLVSAALIVAGAACFGGIGLLVAGAAAHARGRRPGLMNLVQLPMWLLGGTFFSVAHFPDWLRPFVERAAADAVQRRAARDDARRPVTQALVPAAGAGRRSRSRAGRLAVRVFRWS
jgi:membrane protein implicated in regulation of membrane protease activity